MWKISHKILIFKLLLLGFAHNVAKAGENHPIEFWGNTIVFEIKNTIPVLKPYPYEEGSIEMIGKQLNDAGVSALVDQLKNIIKKFELCDWLAYQLIRSAAHQLISKKTDYLGYTATKWFLLNRLGYDPALVLSKDRVLLYIKSNDVVYNIPFRMMDGKQFICLNYHDYGYQSAFQTEELIFKTAAQTADPFTFKISNLPKMEGQHYIYKDLTFDYGNRKEHLNIKLNTSLKKYFVNYPVTEYFNQFNIPFSEETRNSLIAALKQKIKGMNTEQGVEYLMYFTRQAFVFQKDIDEFGREKRLSPEETLLYGKSDCEDRSALFYSLVKEIYNLPMIILSYPEHVTVAVKLDKPVGKPVRYKNELYTVCEPTPQSVDLKMGEQLSTLHTKEFEIAFSYHPGTN